MAGKLAQASTTSGTTSQQENSRKAELRAHNQSDSCPKSVLRRYRWLDSRRAHGLPVRSQIVAIEMLTMQMRGYLEVSPTSQPSHIPRQPRMDGTDEGRGHVADVLPR